MKTHEHTQAICPLCGSTYEGHPALSREDNETLICPDCGTRQALAAVGLQNDDIEQILEVINRYRTERG